MKYTSILKNKLILILSMLLLATSLLAQDEDIAAIEKKKRKALQDEGEEGFQLILPPEINIEPEMNIECEINIESPHIEIPKEIDNQKFLLPLLRDKNPGIRAEAAKTLGAIGDQGVVSPLSKRLRKDKNSYVRYNAAWALGEIGGKESLFTLKKALKREKNRRVKRMIEKSIKKIESGHSVSSGA